MKIISLIVFSLIICCGAAAQTTDSNYNQNGQKKNSKSFNHMHYEMQDGHIVLYSHGVKNAIIKDITLPDGTTITTEGKVTWKNGKTVTLQDGESIDMNGKIHKWNQMNDKNHRN